MKFKFAEYSKYAGGRMKIAPSGKFVAVITKIPPKTNGLLKRGIVYVLDCSLEEKFSVAVASSFNSKVEWSSNSENVLVFTKRNTFVEIITVNTGKVEKHEFGYPQMFSKVGPHNHFVAISEFRVYSNIL